MHKRQFLKNDFLPPYVSWLEINNVTQVTQKTTAPRTTRFFLRLRDLGEKPGALISISIERAEKWLVDLGKH